MWTALGFVLLTVACGHVSAPAGDGDSPIDGEDGLNGASESGPAVELLDLIAGSQLCFPDAASADGSIVVGACLTSEGEHSVKWQRGTPPTVLDVEAPSRANAVTPDGALILGSIGDYHEKGYLYDAALRERLPVSLSSVSDDGSILAGSAFGEQSNWDTIYALRGRAGGELQRLTPFKPGGPATVTGLSGDGRVAVGSVCDPSGESLAALWSEDGALHLLEALPGATSSEAASVNRDGSVIVGHAHVEGDITVPVRWTWAGVERLTTSPGVAFDVSADGRRILVQLGVAPEAFDALWEDGAVWPFNQMVSAADLGRSDDLSTGFGVYGITSNGQSVYGISYNFVGDGARGFVARIQP